MSFTPPKTPPHPKRQSSSNSFNYNSPGRSSAHSRRSSMGYSPTSRHRLSRSEYENRSGVGGGGGTGGGMANLADELGDAWGSGEEEEDLIEGDSFEDGGVGDESGDISYGNHDGDSGYKVESNTHDAGPANGSSETDTSNHSPSSPTKQDGSRPRAHGGPHQRHSRTVETITEVNGDALAETDDDDSFPPRLEARLLEVQELAEAGTSLVGEEGGATVRRMLIRLQELGSQSGIDAGVTCLATAHNALSTHFDHQSRHLTSLTSTLFTPFALDTIVSSTSCDDPTENTLDQLLSDIDLTLSALPHPSSDPLRALHTLVSSTSDVLTALSHLADSLHEARQAYQGAGRRLRSAREVVEELRREREAAEEGVRWLEKGHWPERLQRRECAKECREVVGGFEKVCEGWRDRVFRGESVVG